MIADAPRRRPRRAAPFALMALLALAALGPAACGVKNPPELPPGQTDQYPRQYPAPEEP